MERDVRAATVQFNHRPGDKQYNFERIDYFVRRAAEQGVELIAFPEMCITGYWHVRRLSAAAVAELAEVVPEGVSTQRLCQLANDYSMVVGAGLIERGADGGLYNTYCVALPGGRVERHRKLHTFISPHMASGASYTVFDTPLGCRVGVLICYDNNLVENTRITALMGAEVLLAPHQTGGCRSASPGIMGLIDPALWAARERQPAPIEAEIRGPKGREWLLRWLPARAHDNGLFHLFSNGVGPDDGEVRTGNAMILDPYGDILAETARAADDMVVADLRAQRLADCPGRRRMGARRPELYGPLSQATGTEDDIRAVRFAGAAAADK
ncbi:MAG: acyltransferase [Candidatus Latescibacteria bacterium]|nr:acyltransferase [Candidatus Latescibacterota bacterium]